MARTFLLSGAIAAFLGVALGAFGAHGLRGRIEDSLLAVYQTGVQYHLIHAVGLILIGIIAQSQPSSALRIAGWSMLAGIVLFSGSLYLLSITGLRYLGAVAPLGGLSFLAGWAALAVAVLRQEPPY